MYSLKTRQICLFFIAFLPATTMFFYPSVVAAVSEEDCWLSALLSLVIDALTIAVLLIFIKRAQKFFPEKNYFDLLEDGLGKIGAKIIIFIYFVFFLAKSVIPIVEQKNYVDITLYETTPYFYMFLPFFATSFYLCLKKIRIIGRLSDLSWIFTVSGITFLIAISFSNVDFSAILPIGANGLNKIAKGTFISANWFSNAAYMAFFIGEFKPRKKDGIKIFSSFVFSELITVFALVVFYGVFTYTARRQQFALTEIAKFSTVISNVGRFDYIGIFALLFSNAVSLALPLYFSGLCLCRLTGIKNPVISSLTVNGILILIVFLTEEFTFGLKNFILEYLSGLFIFAGNLLPVLTVFIPKKGAVLYEKS